MFGKPKGPSRDEFDELRSEFRRLKAEWLDVSEKLQRLYDRTRKRQERENGETHPDTLQDVKARLRDRVFGGRANGHRQS